MDVILSSSTRNFFYSTIIKKKTISVKKKDLFGMCFMKRRRRMRVRLAAAYIGIGGWFERASVWWVASVRGTLKWQSSSWSSSADKQRRIQKPFEDWHRHPVGSLGCRNYCTARSRNDWGWSCWGSGHDRPAGSKDSTGTSLDWWSAFWSPSMRL